MGFLSWLTGRDEKESDVYANYDKVDSVVSEITDIANNKVVDAQTAINEAITALNNVNGVAQYVGQVEVSGFDSVYESIASSITQIGEQLQGKAEDIKTYEESAWYEKLGSTFMMSVAKFGEGVLSVAEDIGDGVVSVVGWVAPEDSGLEKACASFVENNWSHDVFNFYYNSDFAKKSAYTEDSAIAGTVKIAGSVVGYTLAGNAAGKLLGKAAGGVSQLAAKSEKITSAASSASEVLNGHKATSLAVKALSGSANTYGNAVVAGLAGMGSGTENALKNGAESFDEAAAKGAKQGAIQGTLAYGIGRYSEVKAQKAVDKVGDEAEKSVQKAENIQEKAEQQFTEKKNISTSAKEAERKAISDGDKTEYIAKSKLRETAVNDANEAYNVKKAAETAVDDAISKGVKAIEKAETAGIKAVNNSYKVAATLNSFGNVTTSALADAQFRKTSAARSVSTTPAENTVSLYDDGDVDTSVNKEPTSTNSNDSSSSNNNNTASISNNSGNSSSSGNSSQQFRSDTDYDDDTPSTSAASTTAAPSTSTAAPSTSTAAPSTSTAAPSTSTAAPSTSTAAPSTGSDTTTITTPTTPGGTADSGTTVHTGGGYSGTDGYTSDSSFTSDGTTDLTTETDGTLSDSDLSDALSDGTSSIEDVIKGSNYTKIPTSSKPVTSTTSSSGSSAVIPIAAGLSAAAAAGIGAKAYMDRKKNNDNGEDDDEFDTDEWTGDDSVDIQYDDSSDTEQVLDADDDYSYQSIDDSEKYDARSSDELADLQ